MIPFQPNDDWCEKQWYSQEPMKYPWRAPMVLASLAALFLAVWLQ
jgi:hypothetical protein